MKCNNKIKQYKKLINYDNVTQESINNRNLNYPLIPHNPYRIIIIGTSGFDETKALLKLIK